MRRERVLTLAFGDYEHIVEFSEVDEHRPEDMAFLCKRCHGKVTNKMISKAAVRDAKAAPRARESGFSREDFFASVEAPEVSFGPTVFTQCRYHLVVDNEPIFWVAGPEVPGGPVRVNARLRNSKGDVVFEVIDNEWRVNSLNWDAEIIGNILTLRSGKGQITLVVEFSGPDRFAVRRMDFQHKGYSLKCDNHLLVARSPDGAIFTCKAAHIVNYMKGISLFEDGFTFLSDGPNDFKKPFWGEVSFDFDRPLPPIHAPNLPITLSGSQRNAQCKCGSNKRFKHCCGRL